MNLLNTILNDNLSTIKMDIFKFTNYQYTVKITEENQLTC